MLVYLIWYFFAINVVAYFLYGIDKSKAMKGKWRIPESTLILFAVFGGSIGALCGMKIFHHKTKKPKFYLGIPAILIMQVVVIGVVIYLYLAK